MGAQAGARRIGRNTLVIAVAAAAAGYALGATVESGRNRPEPLTSASAPPQIISDAEIASVDPRLAADIGHMALEGGNPALAAKLYARCLEAETAPPEVYTGYTLALRRTGRVEEAAQVLHQALVVYPAAPLVRYHAGLAALHAGEDQLAADHLSAFVSLAPDHPAAAGARTTVESIRRKAGAAS